MKVGVVTRGSVELLAYSGTNAGGPVRSAVASTTETKASTLTGPAPSGAGAVLLSYWAARTSVDTTITPTSGPTVRSAEPGSGGGRITSAAADSDASHQAAARPQCPPRPCTGWPWSVLLQPAA